MRRKSCSKNVDMKVKLQGRFLLALALFLKMVFSGSVYASHTMGADLTYQCLGNNTYKVTVSFYRDCIGIPAPANPLVTIKSVTCNLNLSVTCYPRPGTGKEVTPSCSTSVTTCNGGTFTGIQEWIYDGIITLPAQCSDWIFGYSLCCRNAAITTINSPSSNTFYIYASLNNIIAPCNSSPTFSNKPVPFLCLGQQFCFNHGAYDADGDSLVYQLITPKQTATTNVSYHSPYNSSNPLNSMPSTTFSSLSGDICLTPQALEVTVMAVLVKEYRNGVLIGTVERDLQLTVMNCANNLPTISGINGTNNFSMTICANTKTCFNLFSSDPDIGQKVTVIWNYGITGATFTTSSGPRPTGTFCWTPTSADIGHSFTFTASATDDACPYNGSQTRSYTINVIGMNVNAGPDQSIACTDLATITANATGSTGTYTYLWNTGSTMQSITVGPGTYIVTANDGSCSATDTVVIQAPFTPIAAFTSTTPACENLLINFYDKSTTAGGIITSWHWSFGDGDTTSLQNPVHLYPSLGSYMVTLIVENSLGCSDTISISVAVQSTPIAGFNWGPTCINTQVAFTDNTLGVPSTWTWIFGDGGTSNLVDPSHIYTSVGSYVVTLIVTTIFGCADTAINTITVHPLPIVNAGPDMSVCLGKSVTISASGGLYYSWMPYGQNTQSIVISPSTSVILIVTGTDSNTCQSQDTMNVIINPLPLVNAGSDQLVCSGSSTTLTATGGTTYTWNPGGSTSPSISVSPASSTTYTIVGTDAIGCSASDDVVVSVGTNPIANAGPDVTICNGSNATLTATGGTSYLWSPGGMTTSTITVSPSATQNYQVIVTNAFGCTSTDNVVVNVNPLPTSSLQSLFLCSGSNATLDAGNPGSIYSWNTGATTQSILITAAGNYSVSVTDINGCVATSGCNITYSTVVTVNRPTVSFCQGDSTILNAGYSGMTYSWSPGGQTSQTIPVFAAGNYVVTVTDTAGCSGNINFSTSVNPLPVGNFTFTPTCNGNLMFFTNTSTITSGLITGWSWNFGDGSTSFYQNPSHFYSTSGTYTVSLTVNSSYGCISTISKTVTVNPLPVTNFSYSNNCLGTAVVFTNSSTVSVGIITGYNWNFGDGTGSTLQNPLHNYTSPGTYTVILQATTAGGCVKSKSKNITINPSPVVNFLGSTVCLGGTTVFSNSTLILTGSISSFNWNFNDTYASTQSSPSHTYASAGTYSVQLIATSSFGCKDTVSRNVIVNPLPVANAGSDKTICAGAYSVLSASGGISYSWNPGGMTTSSVTVSPASTTTYTVSVTNSNGCVSTDQVIVNVNSLPDAQAGTDQATCIGNSVALNGTGGMNYNWSPGSYSTSTVTVNPTNTTNFILTVTDANGCIDKDTVTVTVHNLPQVTAGPDISICYGSTTSLTATGAANYQWNPIGLNSASVLITPSSTSTYSVIGTDSNGCISSDTITVAVLPVPVVNFYPTFICPGTSANLDAGNPGSQFSWSTGESSQIISISDSGSYSVIVTSNNGCPTYATTTVTVGASMTAPPVKYTICAGQTAQLNAGNSGSSYVWSTGETTQIISVQAAGNYSVTITDPNGCVALLNHIVTVNPLPDVSLSASPACFGSATQFQYAVSISSGTIQSAVWNFGDGYSSASFNASHIYSSTGTFPVTLNITSTLGCSALFTGQAIVNPKPVAEFATNATCRNTPMVFTNQSTISSGTLNAYNWIFGDGGASASFTPSHLFTSAGTYNSTLIVTSNNGCSSSVTHSVTVKDVPRAGFIFSNSCENKNISLVNTSVSQGTGNLSYQWNFGNGNTSIFAQPVVQYATAGNYTIALIVTSANGCTDTTSTQVVVYPVPTAAFQTTPSCEGTAVVFNNTSSVSAGTIQSAYWTFGDNSTSSSLQPSHIYTSSGNYPISLVVTSSSGCRDSISQNINIYPLPQVVIAAQDVCFGSPVAFQNSSTISSGTIASYQWNFNDGNTSVQNSPVYNYAASGTFNVILTAVSDQGCSSTGNMNLNIFPQPIPGFATADVCLGSQTQFVNQSAVPGGEPFTSNWTFGDGQVSTSLNPQHQFQSSGNYNINLTVVSSHGCSANASQNSLVHIPPMARFVAPDNCAGAPISFSNQSTTQDGNITSSLWTFGDGTSSVEINPIHMYTDSGAYNVELLAITNFGCQARYSDTVAAFSHPTVNISIANACAGSPAQFTASTNVGGNMQYSWTVGNGYTSSSSTFNHTFNTPGAYNVSLTATSAMGCSGTTSDRLIVYANPVASFSTNETCQNSPTYFSNQSAVLSGSISSYSWTFGDSQQSSQFNPPHTYGAPGTYTASLTTVSDKGCIGSVARQVVVHPNPTVTFNAGTEGCSPVSAGFFHQAAISSGSIAGWLWNFGDGVFSTDAQPHHSYNNTGSYDVSLTVISDFGCQASYSRSGIVKVYPQPTADFSADPMETDIQMPVVHFDNNSQNFQTYQWIFGDGSGTSTELNPTHTFADTGVYSAMLITVNNYGCRDTIMKKIEIKLHSTLFIANCFTPNGDGRNDVFRPYHTNMEEIKVWVFDRWGKMITSWEGLDGSWDGFYQGRKCQADTYVYKIVGTGLDGKHSEWVGHVSIVY